MGLILSHRSARRLLLATAVALALITPTAVLAARAPTRAETNAIAEDFKAPGLCLLIRISTVNLSYAYANWANPLPRACRRYANAVTRSSWGSCTKRGYAGTPGRGGCRAPVGSSG